MCMDIIELWFNTLNTHYTANDYIQTTEVILKALLILEGQPVTEKCSQKEGGVSHGGKKRNPALAILNEEA